MSHLNISSKTEYGFSDILANFASLNVTECSCRTCLQSSRLNSENSENPRVVTKRVRVASDTFALFAIWVALTKKEVILMIKKILGNSSMAGS
jgi:hypothetical protein